MLERRSRKPDRSVILLALIILVVAASGVYAFLQLRVDQITEALKKNLPLNTLFIFSDGENALFFEVFFYTPETRKGSLSTCPRTSAGSSPASTRWTGSTLCTAGPTRPRSKRGLRTSSGSGLLA